MHATRLYRPQAQLQLHRNWLKSFVYSLQSKSYEQITSSINRFSTRPAATQVRKTWQINHAKTGSKTRPPTIKDALDIRHRLELRDAINAYDIERVAKLYGSSPDKRRLGVQDLSSIGQCIHYAVRLYNQTPEHEKQPEVMENITDLINELIKDIQGKKLAPTPKAYKYILGALKEAQCLDPGIQFWRWLEAQDDQYLNHDVYAAAIELLAIGDVPLSELEELYSTCLARFPGTFLAYHLSSDAIVSDRERETPISDVPLLLLQAITTARLLRGDTRGAYMALDTALRLCPARIPQRFFNLFIDERPVSEGFIILAIACRSGQPVGSSLFKRHLVAVRRSINKRSLKSHVCAIRAMIASMYLYIGAGGQLKTNSLSELVIAITRVFRLPGIGKLESSDRQQLVDSTLGLIKKIFESFARYGTIPHASAFNSIIVNIGGYGQSRNLVNAALADMKAVGLQPDDVTRRSLITAGGLLGDSDLLQQAWKDTVRARAFKALTPDHTDFIVLMRAAGSTNQMDFAQQQYQAFHAEMSEQHIEKIEKYLNAPILEKPEMEQDHMIDLQALLNTIQAVDSDMDTMNKLTQSLPDIQDFGQLLPPARLLPCPKELLITDEELRHIYDELTTEKTKSTSGNQIPSEADALSKPPVEGKEADGLLPEETRKSDVSLTNVGYGVLRYENWKSINHLLSLSEKHDQAHRSSVDRAISAGERPPQRNMSLTEEEQELQNFGLSDFTQRERAEEATAKSQDIDTQKVRSEIVRLRGV